MKRSSRPLHVHRLSFVFYKSGKCREWKFHCQKGYQKKCLLRGPAVKTPEANKKNLHVCSSSIQHPQKFTRQRSVQVQTVERSRTHAERLGIDIKWRPGTLKQVATVRERERSRRSPPRCHPRVNKATLLYLLYKHWSCHPVVIRLDTVQHHCPDTASMNDTNRKRWQSPTISDPQRLQLIPYRTSGAFKDTMDEGWVFCNWNYFKEMFDYIWESSIDDSRYSW